MLRPPLVSGAFLQSPIQSPVHVNQVLANNRLKFIPWEKEDGSGMITNVRIYSLRCVDGRIILFPDLGAIFLLDISVVVQLWRISESCTANKRSTVNELTALFYFWAALLKGVNVQALRYWQHGALLYKIHDIDQWHHYVSSPRSISAVTLPAQAAMCNH